MLVYLCLEAWPVVKESCPDDGVARKRSVYLCSIVCTTPLAAQLSFIFLFGSIFFTNDFSSHHP